jgi:hypothetical protein
MVTVGAVAGCGEELEAMGLFNAADGDLLEAKQDGRNKALRRAARVRPLDGCVPIECVDED